MHRRSVAWFRAHPRWADAVLMATVAAIGLLYEAMPPTDLTGRDPNMTSAAIIVVGAVPLVWRRSHPLTAITISGGASLAYILFDHRSLGPSLAVIVAMYSVAAHANRRDSVQTLVWTALALGFVLQRQRHELSVVDVVANYLVFGTAWILGDNVRSRRAYTVALEQRTALIEADRAAEAQRAIASERARIASDLHDVVAHSMSVMVIQAAGARQILHRDPQRADEALASIAQTGRQALDEMRRLVGVLRTPDDPQLDEPSRDRHPQPSLHDLDRLVAQFRAAGLPVACTVAGDAAAIPASAGLTAYRIVQEALTNTLKHAGPATAEVTVQVDADQVRLSVTDDGRGATAAARPSPGGLGLVGMRERVEVFGGALHTGPRPGGGYLVRASLPLHPAGSRAPW